MVEYINKWKVVDMLTELENEFQQYKPFHGFEHPMYRKVCEVEMEIGKMQGADVAPVVHGRWESRSDVIGFVRCSVCHDCNIYDDWADGKKWNYCPNCGAKMDMEVKDV